MSLINLGKYGDRLKRLDTTFNMKNGGALAQYANGLRTLSSIDDIKSFIKTSGAPKDFVNTALKDTQFNKSLGKRSDILGQLQSTIKELPEDKKFSDLGDSLTALGNGFKYLASTGGGMAAIGATRVFGGLAAISTLIEQVNKLRGFDYGTNQEKAATAIKKYEVSQTELSAVSSRLEEIETRKKSLESSGPLSLTDKIELQTLQEESTALERQQKILQTMTDAQKASAANVAAKSLSTTQESDISGARFDHNINGEAYLDLNHKEISYMNDAEQILSLVDEIESTSTQIENLQKLQADSKNIRDIEKYQKQIDSLTAYQSDLNTLLDGRVDTAKTNYEAIAGYDQYKDLAAEYENAFTAVTQMGKSTDEIKQNSLESFFSDSDNRALTNRLQELASEGKLTQDSLNRLGITLSPPFKRWTFHLLNKPFSVLGFSARKETYICYC